MPLVGKNRHGKYQILHKSRLSTTAPESHLPIAISFRLMKPAGSWNRRMSPLAPPLLDLLIFWLLLFLLIKVLGRLRAHGLYGGTGFC